MNKKQNSLSQISKSLILAGAIGIVGLSTLLGSRKVEASVSDVAVFRALPMVVVWGADNFAENAPTNNFVASDFVLLTTPSGSAGADLTAGNVFPIVTSSVAFTAASNFSALTNGTLIQINSPAAAPAGGGVLTDNPTVGALNAADSLTAFGVQAATNIGFSGSLQRSFYVSSNTAFDIFAQSGAATTSGDFVALTTADVQITALGITVAGNNGLAFGANAQTPLFAPGTGFAATPIVLNTIAAATKLFGGGRRTALTAGNLAAQSVRFDITYGLVGGYSFHRGNGFISVPVTYTIFTP